MAVHRTFLTDDGQKAPVKSVKKMWGPYKGTSMRLARGRSGVSPAKAFEDGVRDDIVIVTEGIEDAITAALQWPDARVMAAGALGNLGSVPIYPCAGQYIVVQDNDSEAVQRTFNVQLDKLASRIQVARDRRGQRIALDTKRVKAGHKDLNALWMATLAAGEMV